MIESIADRTNEVYRLTTKLREKRPTVTSENSPPSKVAVLDGVESFEDIGYERVDDVEDVVDEINRCENGFQEGLRWGMNSV